MEERLPRSVDLNNLVVGVIGDSWAANKKIDDFLVLELKRLGITSKIISRGHPGAKSNLVYIDLFEPEGNKLSTNQILFGEQIDICIIMVGVNDASAYVGANFYAHHLDLIIKALLKRGVTPLIIELPEFGIEEVESNTVHGMFRRRLMRLVHDDGVVDVIKKYRGVAKEKINPYLDANSIVYFGFEKVSIDYSSSKEIYTEDASHLNSMGNQKLARELSKTIYQWAIEVADSGQVQE